MRKLFAVAHKDLRLLKRDKGGFFFTFVFPILMAVFFGAMMSGEGGMTSITLLIVDQDHSAGSSAFIAKLQAADELKTSVVDEQFARNQVRKGKAAAFLILPDGFGQAKSNLFSGQSARIQLGVDPRRKAVKGLLQGVLMNYAAKDMQSLFNDSALMTSQIDKSLASIRQARAAGQVRDVEKTQRLIAFLDDFKDMLGSGSFSADNSADPNDFNGLQPLTIESLDVATQQASPASSGYDISFPQGILWGIMGCLSTFSLSLVGERNQGTLARLLLSDASRASILAGKALACFLTIVFIAAGLLLLGEGAFGIHVREPFFMLLSILAIGICFSGLMLLFSVISKSEKSASGITWAVMMIMAMTGGGMIPLAFLPSWMSAISQFSPVKWAILALEGPIWRQFTWPELMPVLTILLAIGVAGYILGVRLFKWQGQTV